MNPLHCDCCDCHLDPDAAVYHEDTGLLLCDECDTWPDITLDDTIDMDLGPAFGPWVETEGAHSLQWF